MTEQQPTPSDAIREQPQPPQPPTETQQYRPPRMSLHDHLERWIGHAKHFGLLVVVLAVAWFVVSAGLAIRRWGGERAAAEVAANVATTATTLTPVALQKPSLFHPHPARPLDSSRLATGGSLPPSTSPEASRANPHPELTVPQLKSLPIVNLYIPADPKDRAEIQAKFTVDLDRTPAVTQRISVPPAHSGGELMGFINAGGGDVTLKFRAYERARTNFHPVLELGAGPLLHERGAGLEYGGGVQASLDFARLGDWHLKVQGNADFLPAAKALQGVALPRRSETVRLLLGKKWGSNDY